MAVATYHVRSISLPARSHPNTLNVEAHLDRLRSSHATSSSACNRLSGLKDLYECVDDLLQLPQIQKDLSGEHHRKSVDEMLDGSVRLLDACSTSRDIFLQMKECLKELESSLRKRKAGESGPRLSEVEAYMASKKNLGKAFSKCFRNLKTEKKNCKDSNEIAAFVLLREVEEISAAVFESLSSMIFQPKAKLRPSGWSVVSKFLQSKHVSSQEIDTAEVKRIDDELQAMKTSKAINHDQIQNVLNGLKSLESTVQEVEEELECVYRHLLKTRVAILNTVSH